MLVSSHTNLNTGPGLAWYHSCLVPGLIPVSKQSPSIKDLTRGAWSSVLQGLTCNEHCIWAYDSANVHCQTHLPYWQSYANQLFMLQHILPMQSVTHHISKSLHLNMIPILSAIANKIGEIWSVWLHLVGVKCLQKSVEEVRFPHTSPEAHIDYYLQNVHKMPNSPMYVVNAKIRWRCEGKQGCGKIQQIYNHLWAKKVKPLLVQRLCNDVEWWNAGPAHESISRHCRDKPQIQQHRSSMDIS